MHEIANTPKPPYYVVIFTSKNSNKDKEYDEMLDKMTKLVSKQDGFLGFESASEDLGITVSYWVDENSIKNWRDNLMHKKTQELGKKNWYKQYKIRIAQVTRDYEL